jgi:hypothetical protein
MIMILDRLLNIRFYANFYTPLSIKALALLFYLDSLYIQTQASLLGILIAFVNNFHINLVLMFVWSVKYSSVVNLIYLKQLVLLYS